MAEARPERRYGEPSEATLADAWVEEAKHPKPPTNGWDFGKTLVFWLAVVAIIYIAVRWG